jgi:hypothetical protein
MSKPISPLGTPLAGGRNGTAEISVHLRIRPEVSGIGRQQMVALEFKLYFVGLLHGLPAS